jgi:phage/conjugal plasmid C-4 type zinc finger TraR family protein
MDVFDRAQLLELADRERCIAQTRAQAATAGAALAECEGCGDDIPAARQQAVPGVRRCIDCARASESFPKLFKRP